MLNLRINPFFFVTGDESFYSVLDGEQVSKLINGEQPPDRSSIEVWEELKQKYSVFLLHKTLDYGGPDDDAVVLQWKQAIGEHNVLRINNPKACVDVMLGVIAIISGKRTLDTYTSDLRNRGQTEDRIVEVITILSVLRPN